ncbi:MAG: hypothetical protein GC147_04095 [Porphyrobacter sp.]|nr:hypothetical protein [Porphyrobacter sp.]
MTKAALVLAALAILVAAWLADARLAPPLGAAMLLGGLIYGWLANRRAGRANLREAEEATRRQREERAEHRR